MRTILEFDKMDEIQKDEYFMHKAYQEALIALSENEIPVGAIVVCKDKIIARKPDIPNHKLSPSTIANHCTKPKAK